MTELLNNTKNIAEDVVRNIVNVRSLRDTFSDLIENDDEAIDIANKTIAHVLNPSITSLGEHHFHYLTAINYPFETDHFMASRYSDGSFPVWYGANTLITSIHETVHHMITAEIKMATLTNYPIITRHRAIYDVYCQALLIDLSQKTKEFPALLDEDYSYTQSLGRQLFQQGLSGIYVPSVRDHHGFNINIFKQNALHNPRLSESLSYTMFSIEKRVEVKRGEEIFMEIFWH